LVPGRLAKVIMLRVRRERTALLERQPDFRYVLKCQSELSLFPFPLRGILPTDLESSNRVRVSLDIFDAAFIFSGPFKLQLTTELGEHLTLSEGNTRVFWEEKDPHGRCPWAFPGDSFNRFITHSLGK